MSKQEIEQLVQSAIEDLKKSHQIDSPRIQIDPTKDKQHGDFASNIALMLAKPMQKKPREVAEMIVKSLPTSTTISKVEIAGPGFINFFLTKNAFYSVINEILDKGEKFGHTDIGKGKKVIVEFLSSNPTGPLHVGHGRHAAYGAVVSDLLKTIGYTVHKEYYVNDAGRQMDILTVSVWLRYLQLNNEKFDFPVNAYKGEYVFEIAKKLNDKYKEKFAYAISDVYENLPLDEPAGGDKEVFIDAVIDRAKSFLKNDYAIIADHTLAMILTDIRNDLEEFGVHYDEWFSEKALAQTDVIDREISILNKKGHVYEKEGALWFRATDFHDEKDRVLQRSNGQRTYFANDVAYHFNKMERGYDLSIDIWGSDHHGYVPRMQAAMQALGVDNNKMAYLLVQFVTLYRGNQQVQMSTRSGSFVTLRELREEVGNDAARFFYVMRKCEQHIDFDLELAKSKTNENPVFYIQYAHARICSVFRQLEEKGYSYQESKQLELLIEEHELKLLATLSRYQDCIVKAATQYEPHILTNYLRDLATDFHGYYNSHQFIVEDENLRNARLTLIKATRQVFINGLKLLGVSQPESM